MTIQDYKKVLEDHGIKPSHHRLRVYQYLVDNRNHPNVDMIYKELIAEIPTLSRTTLYNTLNLFVNKGVVQLITIAENEMRYDADISLHGHFRCQSCGSIHDLWLKKNTLEFENLDQYQIDESHLYFKGLCPVCQAR